MDPQVFGVVASFPVVFISASLLSALDILVVIQFTVKQLPIALSSFFAANLTAIWFLNHEGKPVNYSNNCVAIKGIAIVSTAPIERGSEVFIDYKFSNDHVRNLDWYREE